MDLQRLEIADTFVKRWRGLRPRAQGRRLLIPGSSVHGFGMREPLWAVGLTKDGTVIDVRHLHPRRIIWIRGAAAILELPVEVAPPAVGDRVAGGW